MSEREGTSSPRTGDGRPRARLLLVINRYRTYDRLMYAVLGKHFDLSVLWITRPPRREPLPEDVGRRLARVEILDPERDDVLRPPQLARGLRLLRKAFRMARDVDLVVSSTSDSWVSKIVYAAAGAAGRPIAFRKEKWVDRRVAMNWVRRLNVGLQLRLTRAIERRAIGMLVGGSRCREYLLRQGIASDAIELFHYLHEDLAERALDPEEQARIRAEVGEGPIFLYLGRILERKGLLPLIEAFQRVALDHPRARLLVVGGAESRDTGRGAVSSDYLVRCRETAGSGVVFWGEVHPGEVQNLFAACDVFVHPHVLRVGQEEAAEGWGNVVSEAASMARPVIATDRVASAFDLIEPGESGFVVDSSDLDSALESALRFFCADPPAARRLGERSRQRYEAFVDQRRNVASLERLLKRAAASR